MDALTCSITSMSALIVSQSLLLDFGFHRCMFPTLRCAWLVGLVLYLCLNILFRALLTPAAEFPPTDSTFLLTEPGQCWAWVGDFQALFPFFVYFKTMTWCHCSPATSAGLKNMFNCGLVMHTPIFLILRCVCCVQAIFVHFVCGRSVSGWVPCFKVNMHHKDFN